MCDLWGFHTPALSSASVAAITLKSSSNTPIRAAIATYRCDLGRDHRKLHQYSAIEPPTALKACKSNITRTMTTTRRMAMKRKRGVEANAKFKAKALKKEKGETPTAERQHDAEGKVTAESSFELPGRISYAQLKAAVQRYDFTVPEDMRELEELVREELPELLAQRHKENKKVMGMKKDEVTSLIEWKL